MVNDDSPRPQIWTGLATYKGTLYRMNVLTYYQCWKSDINRAVSAIGAHAKLIKESSRPLQATEADLLKFERVALNAARYLVTLTPDPALTEGYLSRKPVSVLVNGAFRPVKEKDGEFQAPSSRMSRARMPQRSSTVPLKRNYRRI